MPPLSYGFADGAQKVHQVDHLLTPMKCFSPSMTLPNAMPSEELPGTVLTGSIFEKGRNMAWPQRHIRPSRPTSFVGSTQHTGESAPDLLRLHARGRGGNPIVVLFRYDQLQFNAGLSHLVGSIRLHDQRHIRRLNRGAPRSTAY